MFAACAHSEQRPPWVTACHCMMGFHNGMFGPRNSFGPFSQSVSAAMAGPWLKASSFHCHVSGSAGPRLASTPIRVQKALRMAPRLLRSSGSMSSNTATVATIHDPWPTASSVVGVESPACSAMMLRMAWAPRWPVCRRLSTPCLVSPPVWARHEW